MLLSDLKLDAFAQEVKIFYTYFLSAKKHI